MASTMFGSSERSAKVSVAATVSASSSGNLKHLWRIS